MRIVLADSMGFCYGVDRAVNRTRTLLKENFSVHVMGEIVHNEEVICELKNSGLIVSPDDTPPIPSSENSIVILRANGVEPLTEYTLSKRFKEVVDLMCPIVYNVFSLATTLEKQGYFIVIFGKKHHAETRALIGRLKDYLVIEPDYNGQGVLRALEGRDKIALLSQTTMDSSAFADLTYMLSGSLLCELKVCDTVCKVTVERESEASRLAKQCDAVIIIGGKNSSNTRKLVDIVERAGKKALHVQRAAQLPDLSRIDTIGVISGTSTPASQIQKILDYIESQNKGR